MPDKIYLPQQKTRRGKAGYKGDRVAVVDAESGKAATPAAKKTTK